MRQTSRRSSITARARETDKRLPEREELPPFLPRARSPPHTMSKQAPTSDAVQALLELRDKLEKNGRFLTMVRRKEEGGVMRT